MPTEERIQKIPLRKIFISEFNTRQPKPTDPEVVERTKSLKSRGQITPGIARPHPKKKGCFELAAGAIRRVALEVARIPTMDLLVRKMDQQKFEEAILIENLQRTDPDPRAEAELLARLVKRGISTVQQISAHLGKSERWTARRMKLLDVIPAVMKLWSPGKHFAHYTVEMMEFLGSLSKEIQADIAKDSWNISRYRDRKGLEQHFKDYFCDLATAPFDLQDPRFFEKGCGPGCASDSSKSAVLFDFNNKKSKCGHCTNPSCFFARLAKARAAEYEALSGDQNLPIYAECYTRQIQLGEKIVEPINHENYSLKAKETPGAKKVVLVTKDGKMVVRWLPKESTNSLSRGLVKSAKSESEKKKQKIALLQSRRWQIVREDLIKALKEAKLTDLTVDVVDLVTAIGLPYQLTSERWHADTTAWKILNERRAGFPIFKQVERDMRTTATRDEALWSAAKAVLLKLIPEPHKVSDTVNFVPNFEGIAGLIKFPIGTKKREADLAILPPKSWGKVDPHSFEPIKSGKAVVPPVPKVIIKPETKRSKRVM